MHHSLLSEMRVPLVHLYGYIFRALCTYTSEKETPVVCDHARYQVLCRQDRSSYFRQDRQQDVKSFGRISYELQSRQLWSSFESAIQLRVRICTGD